MLQHVEMLRCRWVGGGFYFGLGLWGKEPPLSNLGAFLKDLSQITCSKDTRGHVKKVKRPGGGGQCFQHRPPVLERPLST